MSDFNEALDAFEDALASEDATEETLAVMWGLADLVRAEHERAEELERALETALRPRPIMETCWN